MSKTPAAARRRGRDRLTRLVVAVLAMALFILAYQWGSQYQRGAGTPAPILGTLIQPPRPLPKVSLWRPSGEGGDPTSLAAVGAAHWLLFAVPEPRPGSESRALERLALVYNGLADRPALRAALRLGLVTAQEPSGRAIAFSRLASELVLLQGPGQAVRELRADLGLSSPGDAVREPSTVLLLADAEGRLRAVFSELQPARRVAEDLAILLAQAGLGGGKARP